MKENCRARGYEECIFDTPRDVSRFNEPYYGAFIHGCRHAGDTEETCETFPDE